MPTPNIETLQAEIEATLERIAAKHRQAGDDAHPRDKWHSYVADGIVEAKCAVNSIFRRHGWSG